MRNPYIVGRWVRGSNHYGRQRLIQYLLEGQDTATWMVGTRRMGKTSVLRQLELLTDRPDSELVPLFWDLQGCGSMEDLSYELSFALEDVAERFTAHQIDVEILVGQDVVTTLRRLARQLNQQGKRLFLLVDEAEVLLDIADREPQGLARLRKAFMEGRQRTIITSTKLLARLNDLSAGWTTSPFLFGFSLVNLWKLDINASVALIRQTQSPEPVQVDDQTVEDILTHTNRHPYLIQYLCQRLFQVSEAGQGYLRPVEDEDLMADHILSGFFQIDFRYLTTIERRLLLAVAQMTVARETDILAALSDEAPARIKMFLYGLDKLGYLRQIYGQWALGNEFLARWVRDHLEELRHQLDSNIDEAAHERLLTIGHQTELAYLQREVVHLQQELATLRSRQTPHLDRVEARRLAQEIARVAADLEDARSELARIQLDRG